MTNHSGFKGFKGYDSYSAFPISSLPRLEERVVWALVTPLTFLPNMVLPLQLISRLWQNPVLSEDQVRTGPILSYSHLKKKEFSEPVCFCISFSFGISVYMFSRKRLVWPLKGFECFKYDSLWFLILVLGVYMQCPILSLSKEREKNNW